MSERVFRIIQGVFLLAMLSMDLDYMVTAFLVLTVWEAVTNLRVPVIVTRLRFGAQAVAAMKPEPNKLQFEAERFQRVLIGVSLLLTWVLFPDAGWFFPWFIAAMLLVAGLTNICPTALLGRYLGFR